MERAIFAGGCFWCMIQPFDSLPGIYSIMSGYTGGQLANPTYEQVKSQTTGHTEAVEIIYDPQVISYQELVELYWEQTDPTDAFGQFEDRGSSYRPVIFYSTKEQQTIAEKSKQRLAESGRFTEKIVTTIEPAQPFYLAEVDHQDYYKKKTLHAIMQEERLLSRKIGGIISESKLLPLFNDSSWTKSARSSD